MKIILFGGWLICANIALTAAPALNPVSTNDQRSTTNDHPTTGGTPSNQLPNTEYRTPITDYRSPITDYRSPITNACTPFTYAPGHFTLMLPSYWTVLPEQALLKYLDTVRDTLPGRAVPNYVLALQRKALFDFALPYVLVELDAGSQPTRVQVDGELIGFQNSLAMAYGALHRAGKFGEVKVQPAVYDDQQHIIIGRYSLVRGVDKRRIACVTAIYPYRAGFVRLHGFMAYEDQATYAPVLDEIIAGLRFDSGYAYQPPPVTVFFGGLVSLMGVYLILRFVAARGTRRT
ncbi:MAG: hypothetical protein NTV22_15560 [bacterium]|nr:hypothetical protein [bacterium]